jgi:3-methylcrotonyl-CoA carboxylase alpha subunit
MSESFKSSGKKFEIKPGQAWTFESRPGGWMIAKGPAGERVRFAATEFRGKLSFSIGGKLLIGEFSDGRQTSAGAGADSDLTAQFPGKVRKILVQSGSSVDAGAPLILVEAMKMEFTIKAPSAGKIKKVLVTEGQQLSPGDRFFDFEALK